MKLDHFTSRRSFLTSTLLGSAAALTSWRLPGLRGAETTPTAPKYTSRVSLTTGNDRADLAFRALQPLKGEIARAIGDKRVILKPNNVSVTRQLAATHADNLGGILEFLKSIGKTNVVIAESCTGGSTLDGFANFNYNQFIGKYGAKLMDLDAEPFETLYCFDELDFRPHPCRMSKILLDQNNFIISAAKFKTHDRVVATLSLKNIVVGAPIKERPTGGGRGGRSDKPITHGNGFRGINYNLFALAPRLHPHLAVIDGFEGMEGFGPISGTPVDHRVCVASLDWLAADRVAAELMGIDFGKIGYLTYCAQAGTMGESDLNKIEIIGPALKDHVKPYQLARNIEQQLIWREPVKKG
jgi:uncharacterized protein (DUF362 family)